MTIFREYSKKLLCSAVALAMVGSVITITPEARAGSRNAIIGFGVGLLVGGIIASKHKKSRSAKSRRAKARNAKARRAKARRAKVRQTQRRKSIRRTTRPRTVVYNPAPRTASRVNTVSRGELFQIQTALAALGMYTIAIDGKGGPGTRSAIRIFQAEQGYPRTGRMNEEQTTQLFALVDRKNNPPVITDSAPVNNGDNNNVTTPMPGQNTQTVDTLPPAAPVYQPPQVATSQPPLATPAWQPTDAPASTDRDEVSIFSANEVETSTQVAATPPSAVDQPAAPAQAVPGASAQAVPGASAQAVPGASAPAVNARDLASVFDVDDELILSNDQMVLAE